MAFRKLLVLAVVLVCVTGEALFKPCRKDDINCLRAATQSFLSKTYGGYSDLGIKPIDPLTIELVNFTADSVNGLIFHFKNINVTGLKNLEISGFKLDTDKQLGLLKMEVDVSIVSDVEVELVNHQKSFKGAYFASAAILGTSEYTANLNTVNEKQYFALGPETTQCEIKGEPTVTIGNDLESSLLNDPDASNLKPDWESNKLSIRKRALCALGHHAFATIIHNLRAIAKVFDKSAFFTDV